MSADEPPIDLSIPAPSDLLNELAGLRRRVAELERDSVYRALFENNRDIRLLIDPADGRILDATPGAAEFYGYPRAELCRMTAFRINLLERDALVELMAAVCREGGNWFRFRHRRADGSIREVESQLGPIRLGDTCLLFSIVHDITDRILDDKRLRALADEYRVITRASMDVFLKVDPDGRILDINETCRRIYGYAPDELVGRSIRLLLAEETPESLRDRIGRMAETGGERYESHHRHKNGHVIDVEVSITFMPDGDCFILFVRDISEHRLLEERLRQSQKMEAVGRLAGGVAHDFNNLLTGIIGNLSHILSGFEPDDPRREPIAEAVEASERAGDLTRQLLAFSRRQIIEPKPTNLNDLIDHLHKMLTRLIGETVELVTVHDPELWNARIDRGQVEQIVMNLTVNARDAMPEGGRITIETRNVRHDGASGDPEIPPGDYVRLTITDTGCGMSEQVQRHLFEPFFTTKETGKGTGLGLAMVYGAVRQNDGHVRVRSAPGEGTAFRLFFPRTLAVTTPDETQVRERGLPGGTETIFIVEDEPIVGKQIHRILSSLGYDIHLFANGAEALEGARRHPDAIHLLLTDIVMPGMNGPELAEEFTAARPDLKVIFSSGYTDDLIADNGVLKSGVFFLAKPYSPRELANRVRQALETRAAPQGSRDPHKLQQ